jgi:hypothetical protein
LPTLAIRAEQSAKIAKVYRQAAPMLSLSPRARTNANQHGGTFPGGTIVRANQMIRPDFLISWQRLMLLTAKQPWPAGLFLLSKIGC